MHEGKEESPDTVLVSAVAGLDAHAKSGESSSQTRFTASRHLTTTIAPARETSFCDGPGDGILGGEMLHECVRQDSTDCHVCCHVHVRQRESCCPPGNNQKQPVTFSCGRRKWPISSSIVLRVNGLVGSSSSRRCRGDREWFDAKFPSMLLFWDACQEMAARPDKRDILVRKRALPTPTTREDAMGALAKGPCGICLQDAIDYCSGVGEDKVCECIEAEAVVGEERETPDSASTRLWPCTGSTVHHANRCLVVGCRMRPGRSWPRGSIRDPPLRRCSKALRLASAFIVACDKTDLVYPPGRTMEWTDASRSIPLSQRDRTFRKHHGWVRK